MSSRSSKKRKAGPKLGHRKPTPENPSLAAHYEVVDVLWAGLRRMGDFQREASKIDDGLRTRCALVVDWGDRLGRAFYQHKIGGEMPTAAGEVMVFDAPFDIVMDAAAEFYRVSNHVEPPVLPGEVRAIVLTLGTLTVFRLERDDTPVQWNPLHVSDSYMAKRGDVLLVAFAAWRSDRAEGFSFPIVFHTRDKGDAFLRCFEEHLLAIGRSPPTQAAIEEELRRVPQTYRTEDRVEVCTRVFALVRWLQSFGALPHNDCNGVELVYGSEMELQNASELARELGDHRGDLS